MANPIWRLYHVFLGTSASAEFTISTGGAVIYQGVAHRKPGQSIISVPINDICADWLSANNKSSAEFTVATTDGSESTTVTMINDWSYEDRDDLNKLSAPINARVDLRQYIIWSGLGVTSVTAVVTLKNGTTSQKTMSVNNGTAYYKISAWGDVERIVIDGKSYYVADTCSRYVLYYKNAYGGYDSLLIEGGASEEDSVTRNTMGESGIFNPTKQNYSNVISKKLTLHTSWLSDDESSRMHHLLNSTFVYLQDMERGEFHKVILENGSTPYKTYKSNGGKLVNYTIEVTMAQSRLRR